MVPVGSCIIVEGTCCLTRSSSDERQGGAGCPETPREACMRLLPREFEVKMRSRSMTVCSDGVCLVLTTGIKHQGWKYSTSGSSPSLMLAARRLLLTPCTHTLQPHRRPSAQLMPRADDHRESRLSRAAAPQGLGLNPLSQARPTWCLAAAASMIAGANAGIRPPGESHRTWLCAVPRGRPFTDSCS